jgi:hypothetical protein
MQPLLLEEVRAATCQELQQQRSEEASVVLTVDQIQRAPGYDCALLLVFKPQLGFEALLKRAKDLTPLTLVLLSRQPLIREALANRAQDSVTAEELGEHCFGLLQVVKEPEHKKGELEVIVVAFADRDFFASRPSNSELPWCSLHSLALLCSVRLVASIFSSLLTATLFNVLACTKPLQIRYMTAVGGMSTPIRTSAAHSFQPTPPFLAHIKSPKLAAASEPGPSHK